MNNISSNNPTLTTHPSEVNNNLDKINQFINKCKSNNIEVIIFDWDNTVSKKHMFRTFIYSSKHDYEKEIKENLKEYLNLEKYKEKEYYTFKILLYELYKQGIRVAIASFGMCDMIAYTLNVLFDNNEEDRQKYIPNNLIFGGNYKSHKIHCKGYGQTIGKGNKNEQINTIKKQLIIVNYSNILFVDDDPKNIIDASNTLYNIHTYNMPVIRGNEGINLYNIDKMVKNI